MCVCAVGGVCMRNGIFSLMYVRKDFMLLQ